MSTSIAVGGAKEEYGDILMQCCRSVTMGYDLSGRWPRLCRHQGLQKRK